MKTRRVVSSLGLFLVVVVFVALVLPTCVYGASDGSAAVGGGSSPFEEDAPAAQPAVEYIVGLTGGPSATASEHDDMEHAFRNARKVIKMTSSEGEFFECALPFPPGEDTASSASAAHAQNVGVGEKKPAGVSDVNAAPTATDGGDPVIPDYLLGSHYDSIRCLTLTKGYWTYEVCPFRRANQYHEEKGVRQSEFNLGDYEEALDDIGPERYVQHYTKGTTGRKTAVRYVCDRPGRVRFDDKAQGMSDAEIENLVATDRLLQPQITNVKEPQPLEYEITVLTFLACEEDESRQTSLTVAELLDGFEKPCLRLNEGWWAYEFCHLKHIRQFHEEEVTVVNKDEGNDGNNKEKKKEQVTKRLAVVDSHSLGKYTGSTSISEIDKRMKIIKGATSAKTYASMWYEGGDVCDLTQRPRRTEVRIYCDDSAHSRFVDISERATCEYVLRLSSRAICRHPAFTPDKPITQQIVCRPVNRISNAAS